MMAVVGEQSLQHSITVKSEAKDEEMFSGQMLFAKH
jgi:hypothetical protein